MTDETNETQETEAVTEDITSLLDSVFDDSKEAEEQSEAAEEEKGEPEAKAEEAEPEKVEAVETPATKEVGQTAALIAERKKRQAAEAELKALKAQKAPDPIEDPDGYQKHVKEESDKSAVALKTSISRQVFMKLHDDYAEMEKVFMDMVGFDSESKTATKNIHLVHEMNEAELPAEYVYSKAKEHLEIQNLRNPAYIEKIKAEAREEGRKEALKKKSAIQVPDLTNATASGKNSMKVESLPELEDIFSDSRI